MCPFQHLTVGDQTRSQLWIVNLLHGNVGIDRVTGSRRGRLTGHHQYRFHADAGEGRVAGRKCKGDQQVFAFRRLGHDRVVTDVVRAKTTTSASYFSFANDHAVFHNAANLVHVGTVRTETDTFWRDLATERVVLGQDQIADHASTFANVDLVRPTAVVGELIFGQTKPDLASSRTFSGNAGIGLQEMEQTAMVVLNLAWRSPTRRS